MVLSEEGKVRANAYLVLSMINTLPRPITLDTIFRSNSYGPNRIGYDYLIDNGFVEEEGVRKETDRSMGKRVTLTSKGRKYMAEEFPKVLGHFDDYLKN